MRTPDDDRRDRAARDYPPDVHVLEIDGREFILVGTAHVSRESADLVREVIEKERPDCVCIELDAQRFEALSHRQRWENLDLRQVIRQRQLAPLLANLVLASYQKKLGGALGVIPGTELLEAARTAEQHGIPVALCDRDVRITLRRAWGSMSLWNKSKLLAALIASIVDRPELDEDELRRIRNQDVISELMRELGTRASVGEDDADRRARRLSHAQDPRRRGRARSSRWSARATSRGSARRCASGAPSTSRRSARSRPCRRSGSGSAGGCRPRCCSRSSGSACGTGLRSAGEQLLFWIAATGGLTAVGAALSLAHPLVVLSSFVVAPITTLSPVIGAGHVLALFQAYLVPPMVREFERVADDFGSPAQWWRNRLLRIFLVFLLTTFGALAGNYVGLAEMFSNF